MENGQSHMTQQNRSLTAPSRTPPTRSSIERLRAGFASPDPSARPMVRWWWFGPQVERADLLRDLDSMAESGIGGVECAFVYPMSAQTDTFLSDSFLKDLEYAALAAEERGLRFDVTLGSGWPYGGPHIDAATASRRIHWEREEVRMPATRLLVPQTWPDDQFIAAYIGEGTRAETPTVFLPMETQVVDGERYILVPEGRGPRVMLTAVSRPTGQTLKRAAAGAEGWALDHFSRTAAQAHIQHVAEPLVAAAGAQRIGSVFCDSLEVYDADWTPKLPEEFRSRRGYDAIPHLWKLRTTDESHSEFRADYGRTLTEMLEDNFISVMAGWAESKGLPFRIQGYGEPPATVSSFRHAHAFEGEGWGWDAVTACRWASSAGQLYGQQVISSETWTWNHSPSFRSTPLDILGEAHDHLLMGINQFVGHGWPTSPRPEQRHPDESPDLGRVFYASAALDDRNAWWDAAPALWGTLHRLSWLMRQGHRESQVGIYVPARDIYAGFSAAGRFDLFKETRQHIGEELPWTIRTAGLDFDLFDDDAVGVLDPRRFPLVVLPWASNIPAQTRSWLQSVLDAGGKVLDLGGTAQCGETVTDPGALLQHTASLLGVPFTVSDPETWEPRKNTSVAVTTRVVGADSPGSGVRIHFVANTGAHTESISFAQDMGRGSEGSVVERWDADSGRVAEVFSGEEYVTLLLEGYEATILVEHSGPYGTVPEVQGPSAAAVEPLNQMVATLEDWTVQFPQDSQPHPVDLPHQWETEERHRVYSGSASYSTAFAVPDGTGAVELDLGPAVPHQLEDPESAGLMEASFSAEVRTPVGAVAVVFLDGKKVGVLWKTPYRIDLSEWVTPGVQHELTLVVSNVTSHRLAVDEGLPHLVAQAHENFGRRFGIQTLELALADVASGLLAVPQLRILKARDQTS
ncbi:hypothetical protein FH975_08785 [Nesterenkonia sp. Hz 6-5]|nr:hypothetical protein [Nesterenkonia haasae]